MKIAGIAEKLHIAPRTVERNLKKLQDLRLLRRYGPKKEGYWEVLKHSDITSEEMSVETSSDKLGKTRLAIVNAMQKDSAISSSELARITGISTTAIEKNIRFLKEEGFTKRVGPARGGHWEIIPPLN